MNKPLKEIDGAKVLYWAWSGTNPFGFLKYTDGRIAYEIYGLAICQYEKTGEIYRFSCDENWETQQDAPYESIEEAIENLPDQYKNVSAQWIKYED